LLPAKWPQRLGNTWSSSWMASDPARYAQALYALLRELDRQAYARILVEQPPRSGDWDAVNDRIGRAAAAFSLDTTDLPGT
ncbi:Sua5 family C-terminal domain-containing protein, partial [Bordetella bronchiseptica]